MDFLLMRSFYLNKGRRSGIYTNVRSLRKMLTVLLAMAWLPLMAHCAIESSTGLEILKCTPLDTGGAPCAPSDSGPCCSWESGQYKAPESQPLLSAPLLAVLPRLLALVTEPPSPCEVSRAPTDAISDPPTPWQFCMRTALPPRAPSSIP
jgi:hypothetical protein